VPGVIESIPGFRQFLARGQDKAEGKWSLVTIARDLKRMFVLKTA
jgi:hypothetical protein